MYKLLKRASAQEIIDSLVNEPNLLAFETHEQIKDFLDKQPYLLHSNGFNTRFLYKGISGELLILYVGRTHRGAYNIDFDTFSDDYVMNAEREPSYLVVLALS